MSYDKLLIHVLWFYDFSVFFRLGRKGRTIIFSIHQPRYSIFRLFDRLTLLCLGKVVYHGPANQALDYFTSIGRHYGLANEA